MAAVVALGALWAASSSGSVIAQEATSPGAGWDPRTATLVYSVRIDGDTEIVRRDGATGENVRLTSSPGLDLGVSWSLDGTRIFFQSMRDGNREIYAMSADGSAQRNFTRHPAHDLLVDVAPDGRRIAFYSDRDLPEHPPTELPGHLYLMDLDGTGVQRLTADPLTSTFGPDFSPDGDSLLFARDFDGNVDLVVMDLATGVERRIEGSAGAEYGGRYSPDGTHIVFHRTVGDGGEARIVLAAADGSGERELTRGGQHYAPGWSPDGRWVQFTGAPLAAGQFDILMVAADGGEVIALVATDADERYAEWSPR